MKIWIENKIGFLSGYSLTEQESCIELEVSQEPTDFLNWRFDGFALVHDPENAEDITEQPDEIELLKKENQELKERQDVTEAALLEVTDMLLNQQIKGGD